MEINASMTATKGIVMEAVNETSNLNLIPEETENLL